MEISEDRCLPDDWVPVGDLSVFPECAEVSNSGASEEERLETALRYGFFDCSLPEQAVVNQTLESILPAPGRNTVKNKERIRTITLAVAHAAIRCGLAHPLLDPTAASGMPFDRPVLIVMDTSAVLQGGLDFAARRLAPVARIAVPAIVHMEIVNLGDRFFSRRRRKAPPDAGMLVDHVRSQSGQRALLRLAREHQVERPALGADPLRGVVQPDSDAEDRNLGLQEIQRSFADRLILETALRRREHAPSGMRVMLMTADQGQARMALAEGIEPIFFDAAGASQLFGSTVSGVVFQPFLTNGARCYPVSLADFLWELAATFGSARLLHAPSGARFEAVAMGEDLSWRPHHSRDDLLWTRADPGASAPRRQETEGPPAPGASPEGPQKLTGAYEFTPARMLELIRALSEDELSDPRGMQVIGAGSDRTYAEYRRFLVAGEFAARRGNLLQGTPRLLLLLGAIRDLAFDEMRDLLARVPSFGAFLRRLGAASPLSREGAAVRESAFRTYCVLAELCCAGVVLRENGSRAIHATPENPEPLEFASIAMEAYDAARQGDELALTGAWLEHLAKHAGIHPVRARRRLEEADAAGHLRRFFEGSTPETRYQDRNLHLLEISGGEPVLRTVNLYHGDFLMPGRAAGSMKLAGGDA